MHQHPRPAPRSASSASNRATNPERTNNQRIDRPSEDQPPHRARSSVDLASYTERAAGDVGSSDQTRSAERAGDMSKQDRETTKLNQIIQHFHTKAALLICSSRASLPQVQTRDGEIKQNRWFNIVLGDTDVLVDSLQEWRRPDLADDRPPPLIIETYLDTAQLTQNQALVIVDDAGKRWDVADALASSADSSPRPTKGGGRHCEVVLERWKIELGEASSYTAAELNDLLPNVYKKGVVLFRSLFTFSRFLPAWKLHRKLGRQPGGYQGLRLRFRIRQEQNHESLARTAKDALLTPLCPSDTTTGEYDSIAETHSFDSLLCPAGPLSISVQYRTNTDFTVTDAEALLSSRFAGLDDGPGDGQQHFAGRSLPIHRLGHSRADSEASRSGSSQGGARVVQPTSLGAFAMTAPQNLAEMPGQKDRLKSEELGKQFIKQPPFKAGSALSPRTPYSPSPTGGDQSSTGSSAPQRASSLAQQSFPQRMLRAPSNEQAIASSASSSPKPAPVSRYSSSFANRKRFSGQKTGESATSSGRGSSSSKEKSAQLTGGEQSSSGRTDDDEIAALISLTEKAKKITFGDNKDASVDLSKYKDKLSGSTMLADEMSSSSLIQKSVTPPSRRLSNVPGLSTSSSPSRTLAHMPAVRSRLSTHSIAEERQAPVEDDSDEEPFIFPMY